MIKFVLSLLGMVCVCIMFLALAFYISHLPIVYFSWSDQKCAYVLDHNGDVNSCKTINNRKYLLTYIK